MQQNKCQIASHEQSSINAICFDTKCKNKRVCCQLCQLEFHNDHSDQLVGSDYILNYIKTQSKQPVVFTPQVSQAQQELTQVLNCLKNFQTLIEKEIQRLSFQSLQQFCKDIGEQHNILENKVQGLENQRFNQLAEDMLRNFQVQKGKLILKHSIVKQLGEQYVEFMNQFSKTMMKIFQEMKLINEIFASKDPQNNKINPINKSIVYQAEKNNALKPTNQIIQQKDKKINFEHFTANPVLTGHTDNVRGIDICKQRNLLASGSDDKTVKLWSLEDNSCLKTYNYSGELFDVVFSKQGNLLAFGGRGDHSIKLIDISDLKKDTIILEFKGHTSTIYRLTFSNDSKYLISGSTDTKIIIWDIIQKKESFTLKLANYASGMTISGDDTLIASNSYEDGLINIWNFQNHKLLCSQKAHFSGSGVEFSKDQKMLVSCGYNYAGMIKLWSLDQLNQSKLLFIREFRTATNIIWTVLFSPCDRFIISMCNDEMEIKVLDSQTGEVVRLFKSKATNDNYFVQAAISNDMNIIAYGENNNIAVWRLK